MRYVVLELLITMVISLECGLGYGDGLVVFAGIPPVAGVVKSIKAEADVVGVLIPASVDPHTFDVSPATLERLSRANIFFHTRFPFELRVVDALGGMKSSVRCVEVSKGIKWIEAGHVHSAHDELGADDERIDLHCWLSVENVKIIARNIVEEMVRENNRCEAYYRSNYERFLKRLEEADGIIRAKLEPYKGRKFFVYHPAFGYFARAYNLEEVCIEIEGRPPSIRELRRMLDIAKREGIRTIFIQPQFDRRPAEAIAEAISGKVETLNDLGEDVVINLLDIADKLSSEFSRDGK